MALLEAGLYVILPLESVRGGSVGQGAVGVQHKNSQRKVFLWPDTCCTNSHINYPVRARMREAGVE